MTSRPPSARVLVVDDEPNIRAVLRGYLEADGFSVREAADGEQALAAMTAGPVDVVVLDIMLPGMDGLEVLRRIRAGGDTFVVVVSARTEEVDRLLGLGLGADDYITKPFSPREVVARVKAR
ncbi:MAG: response regulator [Pseudolysinimonas sp.]